MFRLDEVKGRGRFASFSGLAAFIVGCVLAVGQANGAENELSIGLSPNPANITLLSAGIAESEGIFDKHGVKVDLEYLSDGITAYRGLEAGQIDVAAIHPLTNIIAVSKGSKVKQFFAILQASQLQVVSNGVARCEDLKGTTIAIDEPGAQIELMARRFLATCNLTPADVKYATMGASGYMPALMSKQVSLGFLTPERIEEMRQKMPDMTFNVLAAMSDINPLQLGTSWGASATVIETKKDALVRFTAAMIDANSFIRDPKNKDKVLAAMQSFNKISGQTAEAVYPVYLSMKIWPEGIGISKERIQGGIEDAIQSGGVLADQAPSYDALVDTEIYGQAALIAGK